MKKYLIPSLFLVILSLAVFFQVSGFDFINYDDTDYITNNRMVRNGLTSESVRWALTAGQSATWQPLVWISLMADIGEGAPDPGRFHTTNLILHILNVLLLFLFMARATDRIIPAAFVAALFAVHPLHVESVAWVTERKDVLSTFWGLASLLAWLMWTRKGGARWYLAALMALALGLMAKPMLVTWPFVMLLLDGWPLDRWKKVPVSRLLKEKLPFLALVVIASIIAFNVQQGDGAVAGWDELPLGSRINNALVSYSTYLVKTAWPSGLSILYPHPDFPGGTPLTAGQVGSSVLFLLFISGLVFWQRKKRYLVVGWLWFLGTLVPVSGLVQIGVHSHADRFTYVPLIGIFMALVWLAWDLTQKKGAGIVSGVGILIIVLLSLGARARVGDWQNSITLYEASIANAPASPRIYFNLALAYSRVNNHRKSLPNYQKTVGLDPGHAKAWNNMGRTLNLLNRDEESENAFQKALGLNEHFSLARINYATLLEKNGRFELALAQRLQALQDNPNNAANQNAVGFILARQKKIDEARKHFLKATQLDPSNRQYRSNLDKATKFTSEPSG